MDARMNATQCYVKRRNATQYTELHDVMLFMTLIYMTCIVHKLSCCSVEMAHCIAGLSSRQKQCSKVIRALSETSNTITSDNAICCEMPMQIKASMVSDRTWKLHRQEGHRLTASDKTTEVHRQVHWEPVPCSCSVTGRCKAAAVFTNPLSLQAVCHRGAIISQTKGHIGSPHDLARMQKALLAAPPVYVRHTCSQGS